MQSLMERQRDNGSQTRPQPSRNRTAAVLEAAVPGQVAAELRAGLLLVATTTLRYSTLRGAQFIDITDDVAEAVAGSGVMEGVATVYSRHTTAAIKINEYEPELIRDMEGFLQELLPPGREYRHNDFLVRVVNMEEDECPNGHSHCQHLLLGTSESIPVVDRKLYLGRWQRVFLVELDRARLREVVVRVMGC